MVYLWITTALWAFSFSFIGEYLAGEVDVYFMVLTRVALAGAVFLPWLLRRRVRGGLRLRLMAVGAVQLGCMYLFYYQSFLLLTVPEVLLFTVFTPLYVTLLYDLLRRRFVPVYLLTAGLAVAGTAVLRWNSLSEDYWLGFAVVQGANLCFALGQVGYKRVVETEVEMPPQHVVFGWFFVGALLVAVAAWAVLGEPRYPTTGGQWTLLVWLGVGASGLGYFLWNKGASRVNAGALAVMNNALVPAGLVVNVLIWNRAADLGRLALGAAILLGALLLNEAWRRRCESETAVEEG